MAYTVCRFTKAGISKGQLRRNEFVRSGTRYASKAAAEASAENYLKIYRMVGGDTLQIIKVSK